MGLTGSASSADIIIPKGVVIAYPIVAGVVDADGGIDLGYCQETDLKTSEDVKTIYGSRDGTKAKIVDKVTATNYEIPIQILSNNMDNYALLFKGTKSTMVQVVGAYDNGTALSITSPATLNRAQKLGKRWVSVFALNYDTGSVAFTLGDTVTGAGGATGKLVWKTGVTAAGTLYLVSRNATAFVTGEVITSVLGAAKANGIGANQNDIVLTNSAVTTRYTLGTDYGLDEKSGTVFYLTSGTITAVASLKGYFDYSAKTETVINRGTVAPENYQVDILPFADATENRFEYSFWKCSVKADSTIKLITVSDTESMVGLTLTPLSDGPGATTDYPIFRTVQV